MEEDRSPQSRRKGGQQFGDDPNCQLYRQQLLTANRLFKQQKFIQAAKEYRKYIQCFFDPSCQINGYGNYEVSVGYYESYVYDWYIAGVKDKTHRGTAIDALSLCLLKLRSQDDETLWEAHRWYQKMNEQFKSPYQLLVGQANVLNNLGYFDGAVELYLKVIDLRPQLLKPYEYIAYIYEYKRIQPIKSIDWAKKALTISPNSMYAEFVLAKNQKDIDLRIENLKQYCQKYPKYPRAINYVGFVYGENKNNPTEAIEWHKKAVQLLPNFDIALHNIGLRYGQLKDDKLAIFWQIQASKNDKGYLLPFHKMVIHFGNLKWNDQQIQEQLTRHEGILRDYFFFNLGKAYYEINRTDLSLKCYQKAQKQANALLKQIDMLYNSMANTYYKMNQNEKSIEVFHKSLAINPNSHMAYYNMANVYKSMNKMDDAKRSHNKSIEINPRYAYPYNNLGNIYNDEKNYDEAIKCYKNAVKHRSNYVLAMANLGVCYLKVENFRDAFSAISRAKQLLSANQKDLSPGNKQFLKQTLEKFDKEGEAWRKNGGMNLQMKSNLSEHLHSFEANFNRLYQGSKKQSVNVEKVMKKEIIEIIKLINSSKFSLNNINEIYDIVKKLFGDNEQYFHIIPLIITQHFYQQAYQKQRDAEEVESQINKILSQLYKTAKQGLQKKGKKRQQLKQISLTNFDNQFAFDENLFKQKAYFKDCSQLYTQIMIINEGGLERYEHFRAFVEKTRKICKGIPQGVSVKIPQAEVDQFKVMLTIFSTIFSQELTKEKFAQIFKTINESIESQLKVNDKKLSSEQVVSLIKEIVSIYITEILNQREKNQIATCLEISDMLKGKILFDSLPQLKKAIAIIDETAHLNGFKISGFEDRLDNIMQEDVVFKLQMQGFICQLHLQMQKQQIEYNFIRSLSEISQFSLGSTLGCYTYMARSFHYHLVDNCKDIVKLLKESDKQQDKQTITAALFVLKTLAEKQQ